MERERSRSTSTTTTGFPTATRYPAFAEKPAEFFFQIPGIGRLNWEEFCRAMSDVGYTGTFNFEADTFYNQWQSPIYDYGVAKAAAAALCAVGKSILSFRGE